MKAITLKDFGGPEMMQLGDVDMPSPGSGQILIKVMNSSVNRPDIIQREGNYPPPPGDSEILGLEVAGVVESIGDDVTRFKPGDRVVALVGGGGYAEYAVALENHSMLIPESLNFAQAACIPETYITAYLNLFLLGEVQDKQSVLIHGGGGGVSTAGIQLCKALTPATEIFVTASSGGLQAPGQLTFGPDDQLYVSSLNTRQILRYDGDTGAFLDVSVNLSTGHSAMPNPVNLIFMPLTLKVR